MNRDKALQAIIAAGVAIGPEPVSTLVLIDRATAGDREAALALIGMAGACLQASKPMPNALREYFGRVFEDTYRAPTKIANAFGLVGKVGRSADANSRRDERVIAMVQRASDLDYPLTRTSRDETAFEIVADACGMYPGGGMGINADGVREIWRKNLGNNRAN